MSPNGILSISQRKRNRHAYRGLCKSEQHRPALIAEFENDIRRERQMDGINKARERGTRFGRKPLLVTETIQQVRRLRKSGKTVPEIMRQTSLSKASVYRALSA